MKSGRTLKKRSKPRHKRVTKHVRVRKSAAAAAAPAFAAAAARRTRRMRKGGGGSGTRRGNPFIKVFKTIRDTLNPNQYRVAPAELPSTPGMPLVNKKSGIRNFFLNLGKTKANKQVVVPSAESSRLLSPSAELPSAESPSAESSRLLSPVQRLAATPPLNSDSPEQTILYERPPPKAKVIKVQPTNLNKEQIKQIEIMKQTFIDKLNTNETLSRDDYNTLFAYLNFVRDNLQEIQLKLPIFTIQYIGELLNQLIQKKPIDEDTISSDAFLTNDPKELENLHLEPPYTRLNLPEVPKEEPKSKIKPVKFTLNTIYNIMRVFFYNNSHMYNNKIKLKFNNSKNYYDLTYDLFDKKILPVMNNIARITGERDRLKAVQLEAIIDFFISYLNLPNTSMTYVDNVYAELSNNYFNNQRDRVIDNIRGTGNLFTEREKIDAMLYEGKKKPQLLALLEEMNTFVNDINLLII